jgi:hypothetical protein
MLSFFYLDVLPAHPKPEAVGLQQLCEAVTANGIQHVQTFKHLTLSNTKSQAFAGTDTSASIRSTECSHPMYR